MKIKFLRHLEYVVLDAFTISVFTTQATGNGLGVSPLISGFHLLMRCVDNYKKIKISGLLYA